MKNLTKLQYLNKLIVCNLNRNNIRNPKLTLLQIYLYSYLITVGPRIISLSSNTLQEIFKEFDIKKLNQFIKGSIFILKNGILKSKFPLFCVSLVFTCRNVENFLKISLKNKTDNYKINKFKISLISVFIASCCGFGFLKKSNKSKKSVSNKKLLLLTYIIIARTLDAIIRLNVNNKKKLDNFSVLVFCISCSIILFCWFYYPERLYPTYVKWITKMANMDQVLIYALREIRNGNIVYGKESKYNEPLKDYAKKIGLDSESGDVSKTVPLSCTLVHNNICNNCELHALWRWQRTFKLALMVYLPLNLLYPLKSYRVKGISRYLLKAFLSSSRSSAFLATFVASIWYSVCFVRTRIGDKIYKPKRKELYGESLGPVLGCLVCGLSLFIEEQSRRSELALFVFPYAISVLPLPNSEYFKKMEMIIFSIFTCIFVSYGRKYPEKIKLGRQIVKVFGRI